MPTVNHLVLLLFLSWSSTLWALSSDRDQPIQIEADKLEIDETRHISIYRGQVDMRQGSLHIQADQIILHFDKNNDLEWLEISGKPARLEQLNEERQKMTGTAQTIHYLDRDSVLKLMGNAEFQNHLDRIESDVITVNTETNALQAGNRNGKERVRMLIQPKKSGSADE